MDLAANSCLYFSGISFRTPLEVSEIVYQKSRFVTGSLSDVGRVNGPNGNHKGQNIRGILGNMAAIPLVDKSA